MRAWAPGKSVLGLARGGQGGRKIELSAASLSCHVLARRKDGIDFIKVRVIVGRAAGRIVNRVGRSRRDMFIFAIVNRSMRCLIVVNW
jgi:hypothetical protein